MSFSVKITGLEAVLKKMNDLTPELEGKLQKEMDKFGLKVKAEAQKRCPVDEGFLRSRIFHVSERLKISIHVAAFYAAYVEFGTRTFAAAEVAKLPPDWQEFASRFKSSDGGKSLGMRAQPYLYPAFVIGRKQLEDGLDNLLNK